MGELLWQPSYVQAATVPAVAGLVVYVLGGLGRWVSRLVALAAAVWMLVVTAGALANLGAATDVAGQPLISLGIFQFAWQLHVDALRALLLVGVAGFTLLVALYSARAADGLPQERRYWAFVLWAAAGAAVVLMADNLWLLLVAWEVVTVMLYLLANYGQAEARKGAFKTFAVLGLADAALLLGIVMLLVRTAPEGAIPTLQSLHGIGTNDASMVFCWTLFLAAALAKAGAMPLHTWLPAMAEKSPAMVFAFLPAAIDKLLGIFLLALVSLQMFTLAGPLRVILMAIGAATVLCAVMMAMIQHDLKKLLSFHAVSQVGYMVLGIGTGNPIGIVGGLFHMVNNAIYKSGLFLMAGNVEDETGTVNLDRLGGLARRMPVTFGASVVAALAISGVPPLNGFVSKWFVYQGVLEYAGGAGHGAAIIFLIVAVFGSALTLASFVKVLHSVFLGPKPEALVFLGRGRSAWRAGPMVVLAVLCIVLGVFAGWFLEGWMLPAVGVLGVDTSGIEAAGGTLSTAAGYWSPGVGTVLILVGIALGLLVYLATRGLRVRVVPTFMAGEVVRSDQQRFTGGDFYDTVRRMPGLRGLYDDAEAGAFDGYRIFGLFGQRIVDQLRSWHSGLLPAYVAWVLFGLLAISLWLLVA